MRDYYKKRADEAMFNIFVVGSCLLGILVLIALALLTNQGGLKCVIGQ